MTDRRFPNNVGWIDPDDPLEAAGLEDPVNQRRRFRANDSGKCPKKDKSDG